MLDGTHTHGLRYIQQRHGRGLEVLCGRVAILRIWSAFSGADIKLLRHTIDTPLPGQKANIAPPTGIPPSRPACKLQRRASAAWGAARESGRAQEVISAAWCPTAGHQYHSKPFPEQSCERRHKNTPSSCTVAGSAAPPLRLSPSRMVLVMVGDSVEHSPYLRSHLRSVTGTRWSACSRSA